MCTPAAVTSLQVAGAVTSGFGQYQQGLAESNYYKAASSAKRKEADLTLRQGEQEATMAENEGASQSKLLAIKQAELNGKQAAAIGANGQAGSSSSADVVSDTLSKEKMDQLAVKYNADIQSWNATNNSKIKSYALNRDAEMDSISSTASKNAGKIGAFNSLLSGSGQVADTWMNYNRYAPSTGKKSKSSLPRMGSKLNAPGYPY